MVLCAEWWDFGQGSGGGIGSTEDLGFYPEGSGETWRGSPSIVANYYLPSGGGGHSYVPPLGQGGHRAGRKQVGV